MVVPYFLAPLAQSTTADGAFDIPGVAPGSYQVFANIAGERRTLNGIASVEVAEKDIQNLPIVMSSAFTLSGQFVMEGRAQSGNNSQTAFPRLGGLVRDSEVIGIPAGFPTFNLQARLVCSGSAVSSP